MSQCLVTLNALQDISTVGAVVAGGGPAQQLNPPVLVWEYWDGRAWSRLPYQDPGRLVEVWSTNTLEHRDHDAVSPLDYLDFRFAGEAWRDTHPNLAKWHKAISARPSLKATMPFE